MKTQEIATKQTLALANEQKTILMKFKGLEKIVNSLDEVFELLISKNVILLPISIDNITKTWNNLQNNVDNLGNLKMYKCWNYSIGNNSGNPTLYLYDLTFCRLLSVAALEHKIVKIK